MQIYRSFYSLFFKFPVNRTPRVRQLTRTELAWRVESAQCLRSPQSLTKLLGTPIDGYCLGFRGRRKAATV